MARELRVAIAHDYLTQRGGAERVVLSLTRAFPGAPVHTLLYEPANTFPEFEQVDVRTSWLNHISHVRRHHRIGLPLLPFAVSTYRAVECDVLIASTSGWAHGIRNASGPVVAYCYSPARWLYQADKYLGESQSLIRRLGLRSLRKPLTRWDRAAAANVDQYLAISNVVKDRIKSAYGVDAVVVPAPHNLSLGGRETVLTRPEGVPDEGFMLCVSRLLPYKNVDVVVQACESLGVKLVVVGRGSEASRLRAIARTKTTLLSDLSDAEMRWLYAHCRGVVTASYEDFGLTPLEAAVYGRPSAVLRYGGFLDTVLEDESGVFFDAPRVNLVAEAIERLCWRKWDEGVIRRRAEVFSEDAFINSMRTIVGRLSRPTDDPDES